MARSAQSVLDNPPAADAPSPPHAAAPSRSDADRGTTFRLKLLFGIGLLVLLTGLVVTGFVFRTLNATSAKLANDPFRSTTDHAATESRDFVLRAAPLVQSLTRLAGNGLAVDDSDRLARQLLPVLEANPGITWISYGDESGAFTGVYRTPGGTLRVNQSRIAADGRTALVEHDVLPDGSWRVFRRETDAGYDPRAREFYTRARDRGRPVWMPPYLFFGQDVPGITCAAPAYTADRRLRGVFTVDFDLGALSRFVSQLQLSPHARLFLFTSDGLLLAHPDLRATAAAATAATSPSELPRLTASSDPLTRAYASHLPAATANPATSTAAAQFTAFEFADGNTPYLASATRFPIGDDLTWTVGAVAPKGDFFADIWNAQRTAAVIVAGCVVGAIVVASLLAGRVSQPVRALTGFMDRVSGGDLEARAAFSFSREFRQLSAALNRMIDELRDRLRLRYSLDVAMQVQQRLLPSRAPTAPGLDIAGHSTYCDETGSDYYDFLVVDDAAPGKVLLALGDVMGHGVAAALVMAGARAVLRDRCADAGSLADVMNRLNRMIATDLGGSRFMTMHLAVVDAESATYRWASAGHGPAIFYSPDTDRFEEHDEGGMPLGVVEDPTYDEYGRGPIRPDTVIVVGTDGIWEMPNPAGEQFGKDRLRAVIRRAADRPAAQIVEAIVAALASFRAGCRPADDVTLIVIKIRARGWH